MTGFRLPAFGFRKSAGTGVFAALVMALAASGALADAPDESLLRTVIGETALRQVRAMDSDWPAPQRDCAGLVRHAYRSAFARLRPGRLAGGLWLDDAGRPTAFADAETLVARSFRPLGRDGRTGLRTGDLAAFRQPTGEPEPVRHLMIVVRTRGTSAGDTLVVYHPGSAGEGVRAGTLEALVREAPPEWRPVPGNPAFLGWFRYREWTKDED